MKTNLFSIALALGLAVVLVLAGYFLGVSTSKPIESSGVYPDTTMMRRLSDVTGFMVRFMDELPGFFKPDTVWHDSVVYMVIDSTTPIGSIPKRAFERMDSIVGPQHKVVFRLINYCRGIYDGYDLIPLRYEIEQLKPRTSYFFGSLGIGYSDDQAIAGSIELGFRHKRVSISAQGLHLNGKWLGVGWIKAHF